MRYWGFVVFLVTGLAGGCANDLHAPFQTKIENVGQNEYQYTAATTPIDLPYDWQGDKLRLHYLDRYFSANHLCLYGYDIVAKSVLPLVRPHKDADESDGWMRYTIRCRTVQDRS